MKCGIAGLVTTLDIKISGWSNLRARSRKRIAKKVTKLRKWLLPFEHYRREEDSPMATLSAVAMSYHTEQLFGSHRYHTSKPTFREEMCEILIEQCFLPSHGLRCTKISNLSKFVGVLRKQNYAESNHIDLASFPVPQPAACNYVSKYMYLEGLFTLLWWIECIGIAACKKSLVKFSRTDWYVPKSESSNNQWWSKDNQPRSSHYRLPRICTLSCEQYLTRNEKSQSLVFKNARISLSSSGPDH